MALIGSQVEDVAKWRQKNEQIIKDKRKAQRAEGKDFVMPEGGHGAGVMPEVDWAKYKAKKESSDERR